MGWRGMAYSEADLRKHVLRTWVASVGVLPPDAQSPDVQPQSPDVQPRGNWLYYSSILDPIGLYARDWTLLIRHFGMYPQALTRVITALPHDNWIIVPKLGSDASTTADNIRHLTGELIKVVESVSRARTTIEDRVKHCEADYARLARYALAFGAPLPEMPQLVGPLVWERYVAARVRYQLKGAP